MFSILVADSRYRYIILYFQLLMQYLIDLIRNRLSCIVLIAVCIFVIKIFLYLNLNRC